MIAFLSAPAQVVAATLRITSIQHVELDIALYEGHFSEKGVQPFADLVRALHQAEEPQADVTEINIGLCFRLSISRDKLNNILREQGWL
jgi:hypothetical protein